MSRAISWRAAVGALCLMAAGDGGAQERPPTYVWLFAATGAEVEGLTEMVTEEFEEALFKAGCLKIVRRRDLPELESHQQQEMKIAGADYLSPRQRRVLATATADAVVFGRITDDVEGGQIKIAVSLETLGGVSLADTSVRIVRGRRFDAEERERRVAELAAEVCGLLGFATRDGDGGPGQAPGNDGGSGGGAPLAEVKKAQGYEFTLHECSASGSDLECWFTVRNTRERRKLGVASDSRLVDSEGKFYRAKPLASDGSPQGHHVVLDLPTGIPGRFGLRFKGLGGYVRQIALLDVATWEFKIEWRDVGVH